MKRRYYVLILFFLMFINGCVTSYDYETLIEKVVKIEIIEVTNYYEFLDYIILKSIEKEDNEKFLLDFSSLKYRQLYGDRVELSGMCIKLTYENGEFDIFSEDLIARYTSSEDEFSSISKYTDKDIFENIIKKYR